MKLCVSVSEWQRGGEGQHIDLLPTIRWWETGCQPSGCPPVHIEQEVRLVALVGAFDGSQAGTIGGLGGAYENVQE